MKRLGLIFVLFFHFSAFALQNYDADYAVSVRGLNAGKATYYFRFRPDGYEVTSFARPSMAARLLGFGKIHESARGKIRNGQVIPESYQREMEGDDNFHLLYDYQHADAGEIIVEKGKNRGVLHFDNKKERPLDILALIVQSLLDEENHHFATSYTLLSGAKMRTYQVQTLPSEQYKDRNNHLIPLDVFVQISGNRQTKIYFAAAPLRLVKLQQLKENESRFTLNLLNYKAL